MENVIKKNVKCNKKQKSQSNVKWANVKCNNKIIHHHSRTHQKNTNGWMCFLVKGAK